MKTQHSSENVKKTSPSLPATMQALELRAYDGKPESLIFVERPLPRPGNREVLIRIAASPINPSDLSFLKGVYSRKKLPVIPGFEGSGTVIASGGGFVARALVGRRVACAAPPQGDGTWAEYMVTSARLCVPLRKNLSLEDGASLIVNPLTAWAFIEMARRGGHRAIVQTAAASALGRMMIRLGQRFGILVINVVRRLEQVALLQTLGAKYVLSSNDASFDDELKKLCHEHRALLAFDAVAGNLTGSLLQALPKQGRVVIYGGLSQELCQLDPRIFIYDDKQLEGFWLSNWLKKRNPLQQIRTALHVQKFLASDFKTTWRARLPLENAAAGLQQYANDMTGGKILLVPNPSQEKITA